MGLAKFFEERIERFLEEADQLRNSINCQTEDYEADLNQQKAYTMYRAIRNLSNELLNIVTDPENQDSLAIHTLSVETAKTEKKHDYEVQKLKQEIESLRSRALLLEKIIAEKENFIADLKNENSGLQKVITQKDIKIADIKKFYDARISNLTTRDVTIDKKNDDAKEAKSVRELSFKEIMEQAVAGVRKQGIKNRD
mgnify:CR=1 FL=1